MQHCHRASTLQSKSHSPFWASSTPVFRRGLSQQQRSLRVRSSNPWQEFVDPATNKRYYWNSETNQSIWAEDSAPMITASPEVEQSLMTLNGLAPEVVNARVAMVGFAGMLAGELVDGLSISEQFASGGFGSMIFVSLLVTAASFAPGLRQVSWARAFGKDSSPMSFGPFNPQTELTNGRAAMLGITAIAVLEALSKTMMFV